MKHMKLQDIVDEQAENKLKESSDHKYQVEYPFKWFQNVSTVASEGKCVMVTNFQMQKSLYDYTNIFFLPCFKIKLLNYHVLYCIMILKLAIFLYLVYFDMSIHDNQLCTLHDKH